MYVKSCKNRSNGSIIAKFRSSTFSKLEIEKGRIRNTEKSLRICKQCDSSSIVDETHMLLYCSKFSQEREQLVSKVCKLDNTFTSLCPKDSDPTIVNLTAKSIEKCLKVLMCLISLLYKLGVNIKV